MGGIWWYVSRATGVVAWLLTVASVLWGLSLAARFPRRAKPGWVQDLHRYLGSLTVLFLGIHLVALVADSYVDFGWLDLLVPFASEWRPWAVAWGVVALHLLVAVQLTSVFKRKIPPRAWRLVHRLSFAALALGTVHGVMAGTDASGPAALWAGALLLGTVLFMTLLRFLSPRRTLTGRPSPKRPLRTRRPLQTPEGHQTAERPRPAARPAS